jgi:hypothetical protein
MLLYSLIFSAAARSRSGLKYVQRCLHSRRLPVQTDGSAYSLPCLSASHDAPAVGSIADGAQHGGLPAAGDAFQGEREPRLTCHILTIDKIRDF